jgi:hypothetical protein
MIFDPVREREVFHEFELEFIRNTEYDNGDPMGGVAYHETGDVVRAWLVGLDKEMEPVIVRILEWLNRAVDLDERFGDGPDFYQRNVRWARALVFWMQNGVNVLQEWDAARHYCDAAVQRGSYSRHSIRTNRLDDYMAFCFQAQQYERGIAEFERHSGGRPLALNRTLAPRHIGYALCLHHVRGQFTPDELFKAGRRMLQAHLEEDWLGSGQAIEAATWLKIVYWHRDPSLTPLQTILKAYDDMPKVQRPEFV